MNKKTQWMSLVMMLVGLWCTSVFGQEPTHAIKVFHLKNADVNLAYNVLNSVLARDHDQLRMSVDQRLNAVVVWAAPDVLEEIRELIKQIDIPSELETASEIRTAQLSMVVLVDTKDLESLAELLPEVGVTHQGLLTELSDLQRIPPFKRPRVAGTVLTRISVGGDQTDSLDGSFSNESSSRDNICELFTAGQLRMDTSSPDGFVLQSSIAFRIRTNHDYYETEIETRAALKRGHPVVLGFTSLQGIPCVIIVEVF